MSAVRQRQCRFKRRSQRTNWTELNKSTQLLQALVGHARCTSAHVILTYFVLTGCKHNELGRIVRAMRTFPLICTCSELEFYTVRFTWCKRNFIHSRPIPETLFVGSNYVFSLRYISIDSVDQTQVKLANEVQLFSTVHFRWIPYVWFSCDHSFTVTTTESPEQQQKVQFIQENSK